MLDDEKGLFVKQLAMADPGLAGKFEPIDKFALVALDKFFAMRQNWSNRQGCLDWLKDFMRDALWDNDEAYPYVALFYFVYQIEDEEFEVFKEQYQQMREGIPWK